MVGPDKGLQGSVARPAVHIVNYAGDFLRDESGLGFGLDVGGDAVEGFGDGAGDGGEGVGVAAEGDGVTDGVFEAVGLQGAGDGFRDRCLTDLVELVARAYVVDGAGEVIVVGSGDGCSNGSGRFALEGQPDGVGGGAGALEAFRDGCG